jgi:uncharacterized membrane protein
MKKNFILRVMTVLTIISCSIFISDSLTYLVTALMAFVIMVTIRRNKSRVIKITRWAKANPRKSQVLITVLQIALMIFGIIAGYNLKKLGYELSGTTAFIFSAITVISFLSVHFLPKWRTIAIPQEVNRQRLAFMGIAISSFVMMVLFGNRIEDKYPNSFITHTVKTIDQAIFPDNNTPEADIYDTPVYSENFDKPLNGESSSMIVFASFNNFDKETITPTDLKKETKVKKAKLKTEKLLKKLEKKKKKIMNRFGKHRKSLAAGLTAGAVLLIILLVLLTCTGACLIVGGVAALIDGELLGLLAILGGAVLGWFSVKEIGKVSKRDKEKQKNEPKL